jgi:hypothetical protein
MSWAEKAEAERYLRAGGNAPRAGRVLPWVSGALRVSAGRRAREEMSGGGWGGERVARAGWFGGTRAGLLALQERYTGLEPAEVALLAQVFVTLDAIEQLEAARPGARADGDRLGWSAGQSGGGRGAPAARAAGQIARPARFAVRSGQREQAPAAAKAQARTERDQLATVNARPRGRTSGTPDEGYAAAPRRSGLLADETHSLCLPDFAGVPAGQV